tara:strand:+ start:14163 stop:14375 length:213 start_codon:yes stop_codon:yes gene_type:complete
MATDVSAKSFNPSNNEMVNSIKGAANDLAEAINQLPPSRRRSVALTNLETASMWAVKAVFYNDDNERTDA